jgi:endonuclease/exonuclease/phosphatase family metal-dependent hydrolase
MTAIRSIGKVCLTLGLCSLRVFGFFADPWLSNREIHRIVGEPARIDRPVPPQREHLDIITWNIERGMQYDAILSVLRELDADILLLQEVDRDCGRTRYRHVARDLAVALGMNWVEAGEFQEIGEARDHRPAITGQATLSKFPIEDAEALRFRTQHRWRWSINPVQPRRGGRIALRARTAGILTYNTHIESGGNARIKRAQMVEILADQSIHAAANMPVVIAGDFNSGPESGSAVFRSLTGAAFADALGEIGRRGPTSLGQPDPIDWIFVKNVRSRTGRVVDVEDASDHFPVTAALEPLPAVALVSR